MARKPRSPRPPRSLSLETESAYSSSEPLEKDVNNRDSVPTADLSSEDNIFALVDEPVVQIEDSHEYEVGVIHNIFSAPSAEQPDEEKDSLLARVGRRRKKKQGDSEDEISAMRQQHRAERHRSWRLRILGATLVLCLLAAGIYAIFFSPLFSLSLVEVKISTPADSSIDEGDIRTALTPYEGHSLARLSSDNLARHIEEEVAGTDKVTIRRVWPHGLSVSYSLKEPYACLLVGSTCRPLDEAGRIIPENKATDLSSLVHITYAGKSDDVASVIDSAWSVLDVLDESIRLDLARLEIDRRGDIRLVLNNGRTVVWGQPSDNQRKAEVLSVLLSQPASQYDISAPDAPVTR